MLSYKEYLEKIATLTREAKKPGGGPGGYPANVKTAAQRALFNNLGKNEGLALAVDAAIQSSRQDGWKNNPIKMKRVRNAIKAAFEKALAGDKHVEKFSIGDGISDDWTIDSTTTRILELAKHQHDY
jgi:type I restriction enzyme R subunit